VAPDPAPFVLKSLATFANLTAAEASVFEPELAERAFSAGERFPPSEEVLILAEGAIQLSVEARRGSVPFASVERGEVIGEVDFFEPDPQPVVAVATGGGVGYRIGRRDLINAFHYSRTGAAKFMTVFAQGLSRKIRAANEVLNENMVEGGAVIEIRPSELGEPDLARVQALSVSRSYPADAAIFREGDESTELYVIREGEVEIVKESTGHPPLTLARLGPGDFFGEMAFVDQRPRSATALARRPLAVNVLPAGVLERVMDAHVGTAIYLSNVICKIMARRLNVTLRRIAGL
jgi:CRP/FNR family cyclic AMP-dependent transcriptional regulator